VAVIIDDVHFASSAVLDALEYAALDGDDISLWIAVAGLPRFDRRRPGWAKHAQGHERADLSPLDEADAMELAVALLRPAEYPPPDTLRRLAEWTGGNPYFLTALINNLKRAGAIRQGRQPGSWYVATEELASLPALPVGQWLAERELGRLSVELAACVRVCAVLGSEFLRDELAWVQNAADLSRTATTTMDIDVGLEELRQRRILVRVGGEVWAFREVLFQVGIYKLIAERDREHIHRAALEFWRARAASSGPERALSAVARHGEAVGDSGTAASAYAELGRRARAEHRYVDADGHYTRALELTSEADVHGLMIALRGRGAVRYRLQRIHESIEDLRRARRCSEVAGDRVATAGLLIEESTALDWAGKYEESAALVERARPLVEQAGDPSLRGPYLMAWGRSRYREAPMDEAVEALAAARALMIERRDHETAIVALLLLGPLLVHLERLDQAAECFDEVIELCAGSNDRFHLCVAHLNRAWLWLARRSLPGAMDDLRRAQQLARELGQPILERGAAHNLAEFLHWSGDHAGARAPAQRAYALQRFLPDPVATDALLLGRVLAACDDFAEVRSLVAHARLLMPADDPEKPSHDELALRMLEVTLADAAGVSSADAWNALIDTARSHLPGEELLEMYYFRARMALNGQRWSELAEILDQVSEKLAKHALWNAPFAVLAERLSAASVAP
jgi:tetratricopeptide (TPR) repeat protein